MTTITRRICKLEERFAPQLDKQGRTAADVLRERWRRRLAAEGREAEEDPLRDDLFDAGDRPQTLAETLRTRYRRRPTAH